MNAPLPVETESSAVPSGGIDFSRPFMPEELTPLMFTPGYASLNDAQRLRYNQLNALYFNEQTMFFEKSLARNVLGYFLRQSLPEQLKQGLQQFLSEEEQHTGMFRELNRRCAPDLYTRDDFHFIRISGPAARILDAVARRPQWFPFLLWLMHLQEERAMFFGKAFLKHAGALEPHFVAVQRQHLADEIGHVRWDEQLLEYIWPQAKPFVRRWNVRLFAWMMKEYFTTPKRTAPRIIAALAEEFPELRSRYPEFCRQLRALEHDPAYRHSLYCDENVPMTFKRFDTWPEFGSITGALPGYRREGRS